MPWHAVDGVDDAIDATRSFLFPFDRSRWARLAVVVLFLGGGSNVTSVPTPPMGDFPHSTPSTVPSGVSGFPLELGVLAAVLGLALVVVSSVMRFVFLDALRTDEVRIRGPFRRRFEKGVRFLVFNVGVGLLLVASLAMIVLALTSGGLALFESIQSPRLQVGLGVVGSLLLGLVAVLAVVTVVSFFHFTRAFVAPTMLATDAGVLASWGRFRRVLQQQFWQFVVYLLARLVVSIAVGIASALATFVAGGVISLVGVLLGLLVTVAFGGISAALQSTAGLALLAVLALATLIALLVLVFLPIQILVQTFLTSYELTMLGRVAPDLDLLASRGPERGGTDLDETSGERVAAEEFGGFEFDVVEEDESGAPVEDAESTEREDAGTANEPEPADESDEESNDDADDRPYWAGP